ncbi:MAG: hypothetical protein A2991_01160 [Candidatus Terrybacteria bacterium RIFCSPLOWO2_01_FULL_58_14]|uniref:MgtC/SapB/SrpB/YhiD N-terminal domain-containing protein n=2 Tax=Candidatus Terryibacteriota TaxID=1817920 RepID=A0A1G2Q0E0_9BACT|nr:MAG: hypothetical protein A2682_01905 [Candidatus Terrybacteria bacterium RIFCSPHIGHO2_01_FULL_58_15]OHA54035.1 MAG: hypothetical protein A2991_01160 [Candidatus Terrybacteria bacterium RIFCSPLOWO2_01_FULL_58_14]
MPDFSVFPDITMALRLLLAVALGAAVGFEREYVGKAAGFRTYALVSLGACLFTVVSLYGMTQLPTAPALGDTFRYNYDPTRIVSQIVVGIGFLGAGLIIFRGFRVEGLTTAAGLWVAAAIGTAVGFGFYALAAVAAALELTIFYLLKRVEPHEHSEEVSSLER